MISRGFLPMTATVFAAVVTYYYLSEKTSLSENVSIFAGVIVALISSVVLKKILNRNGD